MLFVNLKKNEGGYTPRMDYLVQFGVGFFFFSFFMHGMFPSKKNIPELSDFFSSILFVSILL